jgi:hypothetical protein
MLMIYWLIIRLHGRAAGMEVDAFAGTASDSPDFAALPPKVTSFGAHPGYTSGQIVPQPMA